MERPASRWNLLWTLLVVSVLSLLAAILGCEPPKDDNDDPAAYYGPAPVSDGGTDACEPAAYYGPQPCGSDQECVNRYGSGWYCDEANTFSDGCGGSSNWPVCRQGAIDAGAPDAGTPDACEPAAYYGPSECSNDAQCEQTHGAGWYCDVDQNPCFTSSVCREIPTLDAGMPDASAGDACEPMAYYGPQPCQNDDECVAQQGEGWYCDQASTVDDGCGGVVAWPTCKQR